MELSEYQNCEARKQIGISSIKKSTPKRKLPIEKVMKKIKTVLRDKYEFEKREKLKIKALFEPTQLILLKNHQLVTNESLPIESYIEEQNPAFLQKGELQH